MKRLLLLVLIGWFGGTELYAQDYERLYKFLDQYGSNWNHGYRKEAADGRSELVNQLGTPAPRYTFSKELNSKTMKGKFVIMNFWSTWCGGCRALCHGSGFSDGETQQRLSGRANHWRELQRDPGRQRL